jgi:hypothetical protein
MSPKLKLLIIACSFAVSACATGGFVSSWKAPDAAPLEVQGAKVAAVVMMKDQASRRIAEDTLAREITARGAKGIAMYTLLPDADPSMEAATRAALEKEGVVGIVTMRPVSSEEKLQVSPFIEPGLAYRSFWGGYYGRGWGRPWIGPSLIGNEVSVDTVVSVETMVYSLKQNKLVWTGTSKTTNPPRVQKFVERLSAAVASELKKQGLIAP